MLTHAWIKRRDGVAGLAHAMIFYGFVVLFIGTGILAFQDDFAEPVLGWDFWQGSFYLGYSLFLDVFGAFLVVGLVILAVKRGSASRPRLDYTRVDGVTSRYARWRYQVGDWVFVGSLLFLGVTGFLLESLADRRDDPSFEKWSPVGWVVGQGLHRDRRRRRDGRGPRTSAAGGCTASRRSPSSRRSRSRRPCT